MPTGDRSADRPALATLKQRLREVCAQEGRTDPREIAMRTVGGVDASTVATMLNGPALPPWEAWRQVVEALGADPEEFERLWVAARREGGAQAVGAAGVTVAEGQVPALPNNAADLHVLEGTLVRRAADQTTEHGQIVAELRRAAEQRERITELISRLESDRDGGSGDRHVRDLRERIARLETEKKELGREIKKLKGKLFAATTERAKINDQLLEVKEKLIALQFERAQYEERKKHEFELQLRDTRERLRIAEQEWGRRVAAAGEQAEEMKAFCQRLQNERREYQRAHGDLQRRLKDSQEALNVVQAQVASYRSPWWRRRRGGRNQASVGR